MKKKTMAVLMACILVLGCAIGGTLAWLTAQTPEVENTFTSSELFGTEGSFTLWEHEAVAADDGTYTLNDEEVDGNTYDILPGVNIPKDPTVDVVNLEEHAYLYIKVTGLPMADGLTATIDSDNWMALGDAYPGVYVYCGNEADKTTNVIKAYEDPVEGKKTFTVNILTQTADSTHGDYAIEVKSDYSGTSDNISLSFEAYMVQATGNGANAAEAWANTYGK